MRHQTPVAKRTLNPVYNPKDATFEFPLYLSLAEKLVGVELVVWDKDMLSKDYLGEVALSLESWFRGEGEENVFGFDEPGNKVRHELHVFEFGLQGEIAFFCRPLVDATQYRCYG